MKHELKLHFITGLPRSGSTLLSAILKQNPQIYTSGITSPLCDFFTKLENTFSIRKNESQLFLQQQQKENILKGLFHNYYQHLPKKQIQIDINRFWLIHIHTILHLFPNTKFICCVRDTNWIVNSLETLYRKNLFSPSTLYDSRNDLTIYERVNMTTSHDGIIGKPLGALREAFFGQHSDKLLLVEYDFLTKNPQLTLQTIYNFLDEPNFTHDFNNVTLNSKQPILEFDTLLDAPGLHQIQKKVEYTERKTILPPDLFYKLQKDSFWKNDADKTWSRATILA